jgi:hypothetical protein
LRKVRKIEFFTQFGGHEGRKFLVSNFLQTWIFKSLCLFLHSYRNTRLLSFQTFTNTLNQWLGRLPIELSSTSAFESYWYQFLWRTKKKRKYIFCSVRKNFSDVRCSSSSIFENKVNIIEMLFLAHIIWCIDVQSSCHVYSSS